VLAELVITGNGGCTRDAREPSPVDMHVSEPRGPSNRGDVLYAGAPMYEDDRQGGSANPSTAGAASSVLATAARAPAICAGCAAPRGLGLTALDRGVKRTNAKPCVSEIAAIAGRQSRARGVHLVLARRQGASSRGRAARARRAERPAYGRSRPMGRKQAKAAEEAVAKMNAALDAETASELDDAAARDMRPAAMGKGEEKLFEKKLSKDEKKALLAAKKAERDVQPLGT